jgi:hypothetical protein
MPLNEHNLEATIFGHNMSRLDAQRQSAGQLFVTAAWIMHLLHA